MKIAPPPLPLSPVLATHSLLLWGWWEKRSCWAFSSSVMELPATGGQEIDVLLITQRAHIARESQKATALCQQRTPFFFPPLQSSSPGSPTHSHTPSHPVPAYLLMPKLDFIDTSRTSLLCLSVVYLTSRFECLGIAESLRCREQCYLCPCPPPWARSPFLFPSLSLDWVWKRKCSLGQLFFPPPTQA